MNYYFYLGWKPKEIKKYLKMQDSEFEGSRGKTIWWEGGNDYVFHIWTRQKTDLGALVHECFHAAAMTLDRCNVKFDAENDEPYAYLVQSIFEKARSLKK